MLFCSCFLCLEFIDLVGSVGPWHSLSLENFWPLFLQIFLYPVALSLLGVP